MVYEYLIFKCLSFHFNAKIIKFWFFKWLLTFFKELFSENIEVPLSNTKQKVI